MTGPNRDMTLKDLFETNRRSILTFDANVRRILSLDKCFGLQRDGMKWIDMRTILRDMHRSLPYDLPVKLMQMYQTEMVLM